MRTNIVLDDELVKEGFKLTEFRTKKDLVNHALEELVHRSSPFRSIRPGASRTA